MSKQTLLKQNTNWVDLAQLGAAPATPAASSNRLYVDANGLLQLTSPAGGQPSRRVITDWGVGTAFPTTGLGRGDVYAHSGIGCLFQWNGGSWRQSTPINANTLAILTATGTNYGALLHNGVEAFVTDTKTSYVWDTATSAWVWIGPVAPQVFTDFPSNQTIAATSQVTLHPNRTIDPAALFGAGAGAMVQIEVHVLVDATGSAACDFWLYAGLDGAAQAMVKLTSMAWSQTRFTPSLSYSDIIPAGHTKTYSTVYLAKGVSHGIVSGNPAVGGGNNAWNAARYLVTPVRA